MYLLKVHIFITCKEAQTECDFPQVKVTQLSEGHVSTIVPQGGATTK